MIRTLFFDIGNVLTSVDIPKMAAQLSKQTLFSPEEAAQKWTELGPLYERGEISTADFYQSFSPRGSFQEFLEALSEIFIPNPEMEQILQALKQKGFRLVTLSNTSEGHFNYLRTNLPHLKLFDDHTLSFQVGALKPAPAIFKAALAKANCAPENCFYTDDIRSFVEGARTMGIDSEQFFDTSTLRQQLQQRGVIL